MPFIHERDTFQKAENKKIKERAKEVTSKRMNEAIANEP